MAYLTRQEAISISRSLWDTSKLAKSELKKSSSVAMKRRFDVFLSHSYEDAEVIAGVKAILENYGLSVYVDWITDKKLDRRKVTAETAQALRKRMNHCKYLVFVTSKASPKSKWMPWELGYFDGRGKGRIGILPIVENPNVSFSGQEYIGLYPSYEMLEIVDQGSQLAHWINDTQFLLLKEKVRKSRA